MNAEDIEYKIKKLKPVLSNKFHVEKIGYFGSYARNDLSFVFTSTQSK